MKFMKLGTKPDTFHTEEATRTVTSDIPSDLIIQINNITYLLHKFPILPKCGFLQRFCNDPDDSSTVSIDLHDIPGGEDGFELCAKFCYGITINLSAHNFVPAFCAAKYLRMSESVDKGNLLVKLDAFFNSCVLEGWKDSIVTLQTTVKLPEWSENLGIVRRCLDSIVEKILMPTAKVTWSYTYTRPGYDRKHQAVPRDWWTEDISDLDIDLFRCVILAVRSTFILPPALIGEALHVYACRWLPDATKDLGSGSLASQNDTVKDRRILETIVSLIPADQGSVSVGFLLKLLSLANFIGASTVTKTDLSRRSSSQLEEATVDDLIFPSHLSSDPHYYYDIDLVSSVLDNYLILWRRQYSESAESTQLVKSIQKIGKLMDSYLQVAAKDVNMPVSKLVSLAEALPDIGRKDHNSIYKAINTYLKVHPDLSKADRKRLCRILDCQKLSQELRSHAVKNERLPLRTVVQVLFFDQESSARAMPPPELTSRGKQKSEVVDPDISKLQLGPDEQGNRNVSQELSLRSYQKSKSSNRKTGRGENGGAELEQGKESKMEKKNSMVNRGSGSEQSRDKGRDR